MPDLIAYGITGFLAWLLAHAGWLKLADIGSYRGLIGHYLGLARVAPAVVVLVAGAELIIAAALLLPVSREPALAAAAGLLLAYALLMGVQLAQGQRDLRCGCAGPEADVTVSFSLVVRNLVCAVLALAAIPLAAIPLPGTASLLVSALTSLCIAVFLVIFYRCCEQLIGNAQRMTRGA